MIQLKVRCDCGQKYSFDVEPVNGQMPFTVACPLCGLDGTAKANQMLREPQPIVITPTMISAAAPAAAPAPAPVGTAMAAPAAVAPAPVPVAAAAPSLRISRVAHSEPESAPAVSPAPSAPRLSAPAAAASRRPGATVRGPSLVLAEEKQGNFLLGVLGALGGAVVGGLIYFFALKYTEFPITGIVVGFMAGLGGWWLGKPGGNELGVIAATLAIACIIAGLYINARMWWGEEIGSLFDAGYESIVEESKAVYAAVPNGTDEEIRLYLAKEQAEMMDELPKPHLVTAEDIAYFREHTYNSARDYATGKITREQYEAQNAELIEGLRKVQDESEGTFKAFFVILLLTKSNLAACAAAAGLAYKMSS